MIYQVKQRLALLESNQSRDSFKHWSKSSVYLKAIRDGNLLCGISTFYKYCSLLGFTNKLKKRKSDFYNSFKSNFPNQLWCADVTIFKTLDGNKYYLHFLMDHYSKMILGYKIENTSSAKAIRDLLFNAYQKYKPSKVKFLSDAGKENVNNTVGNFLNSLENPIQHLIAQKTVVFSNSMIEAFNSILKHQFLYPNHPNSKKQLVILLQKVIEIYNNQKPQMNLGGNTPFETFNGKNIDFLVYSKNFYTQKVVRIQQNKKSNCKKCS